MNLSIKQGWLLVEFMPMMTLVKLADGLLAGKIISGAKEIGMIVIFKECIDFSPDGKQVLVDANNILAWFPLESSEESVTEEK